MRMFAKLPQDDAGAKLMCFEHIRGQRYIEIFQIGGNAMLTTPKNTYLYLAGT